MPAVNLLLFFNVLKRLQGDGEGPHFSHYNLEFFWIVKHVKTLNSSMNGRPFMIIVSNIVEVSQKQKHFPNIMKIEGLQFGLLEEQCNRERYKNMENLFRYFTVKKICTDKKKVQWFKPNLFQYKFYFSSNLLQLEVPYKRFINKNPWRTEKLFLYSGLKKSYRVF